MVRWAVTWNHDHFERPEIVIPNVRWLPRIPHHPSSSDGTAGPCSTMTGSSAGGPAARDWLLSCNRGDVHTDLGGMLVTSRIQLSRIATQLPVRGPSSERDILVGYR